MQKNGLVLGVLLTLLARTMALQLLTPNVWVGGKA
jgi:hypothetical protein